MKQILKDTLVLWLSLIIFSGILLGIVVPPILMVKYFGFGGRLLLTCCGHHFG